MKKLVASGVVLIIFLIYLLQNLYSRSPTLKHHYHRFKYTGRYASKFSKAYIESKTSIELANSEAAQNAMAEELSELQGFGLDIELEDLVSLKNVVGSSKNLGGHGSSSSLRKPTANPMEDKDTDETAKDRLEHDKNEIVPNDETTEAPKLNARNNSETLNYRPKFRIRSPEDEDLQKLSKEDVVLEMASDPLPVSPYCKQEVFLTILVVSQPESVERRKYIRDSWAFSYEDDYKKLKGKQPFPDGKVYIPKNVVRVVFVMGRSKDETSNVMDLVRDEARINKDIVLGDVVEDYRNLTLKTKLGLKWSYYECKTSYVLKTDDDVFINPVPLVEWLKNIPRNNLYTGWCNFNSPVVRDKKNKWYVSYEDYKKSKFPGYCLGGGYLMSGDVLSSVVRTSYGRKMFPMEDLYVGLMIDEMDGVQPRDERKHFNLVYGGKTKSNCDFNTLFLLHRVLQKNLIQHMKQAKNALENC